MNMNSSQNKPDFRPESFRRDSETWLGLASINTPISYRIYGFISVAIVIAIASFSYIFDHSATETSSSIIMPSDGIVDINASYSGIILRTHLKKGQMVSAGDAIAEYKPFEQVEGITSDAEIDTSNNDDSEARETPRRGDDPDASEQQNPRSILASIDGSIHELNVVDGMLFNNMKAVAKIAGSGDLVVRLPVSASSRGRVQVGDDVSMTLEAYKRQTQATIQGKITEISASPIQKSDPRTGQASYQYMIEVKIVDAENPARRSELLGQPVETVFVLEKKRIYQWIFDPMGDIFR
jgi:multidrug resistance efflux pump